MLFQLLTVALVATLSSANPSAHSSWDSKDSCIDFFVDVPVDTVTYTPVFPPFTSQYEATEFLLQITSRTAPPPATVLSGPKNLSTTFKIGARYCTPSEHGYGESADTVLVLTHGLGFDKSYWSFDFPDSNPTNYSFTHHATPAGFATLSYDRLGCGVSQHVDPYNIIQAQVELAVLTSLTKLLREGKLRDGIPVPKKVAHVGHSWGSLLSNGIAASAPELTDAVVLTGFSHLSQYQQWFLHTTAFHLASLNQPARFGHFESGYLTWADQFYNQYSFLTWPFFDPALLKDAVDSKWPFALGEFLTQQFVPIPSPGFKKPVLLMAAEFDLIFCGANCTGLVQGPAKQVFPDADLEVYVQPNSGHGMNLHYNATGWYDVVFNWLHGHAL